MFFQSWLGFLALLGPSLKKGRSLLWAHLHPTLSSDPLHLSHTFTKWLLIPHLDFWARSPVHQHPLEALGFCLEGYHLFMWPHNFFWGLVEIEQQQQLEVGRPHPTPHRVVWGSEECRQKPSVNTSELYKC
jgi:hypothetical protein